VVSVLIDRAGISHEQSLLIGAYFSAEYSFESAALFNPASSFIPTSPACRTACPKGSPRAHPASPGLPDHGYR
jgi:hypothetical protein